MLMHLRSNKLHQLNQFYYLKCEVLVNEHNKSCTDRQFESYNLLILFYAYLNVYFNIITRISLI